MPIKLAIFDLDGTLLNTVEDLANATNYALKENGFPTHNVEEYNYLCGRGIYNLFVKSLPESQVNDENIYKIKSDFLKYYSLHSTDYTKPYTGIVDMLQCLSKMGIKLAIATNKYQAGADKIVEELLKGIDFCKILGQRDGCPIKPDPSIIHEIISMFPQISKDEVIYCGDSDVDMQTGINAGVKTVGVTWGFRPKEELEKFCPWKIIDSPQELINLLK